MVITGTNVPIGNRLSRAWRVNEAAASDVDSYVIDVATMDAEKDEVAGGERVHRNRTRGVLLFTSRAWNLHTCTLINVDSKPAAVETLQIRATEVVADTDELCGGARDRSPSIPRGFRLARDAATCGEEQRQNDRGYIAQAPSPHAVRAASNPVS